MFKRVLIIVSISLMIIAFALGLIGASAVAYINHKIDYNLDKRMLLDARERRPTRFYALDSNGEMEEVWQLSRDYRSRWVSLEDMSENVIAAFLSSEDREFYNHRGVNLRRTAYALINYALKFKTQFGASTITQQLIKNLSGDKERTVNRKISEILRAMEIERQFSKDEILELYLNIVPLTDNIYGVEEASRVYFNKTASELSTTEAATLAAVINAPTRYNPYRHAKECLEKRNRVLYAMLENGKIRKEEYDSLKGTALEVLPRSESTNSVTPWFIETATEEITRDLEEKFNTSRRGAQIILNSGAEIFLTMEKDVQAVLDSYFENGANFPSAISDGMNFSMAVYNSKTGNLSGIVGAVGEKKADKISNYATSNITPASTLKPIALYAPLLDSGKINWSTVFDDTPLALTDNNGLAVYYPKNSPNKYDGLITVKDALRFSKNTVAVKMYNMLGADKIYNSLSGDYGIETLVVKRKNKSGGFVTDMDPSPLALGQLTDGVPLTKLTNCYTVFSNDGELKGGKSYYCVKDNKGEAILLNDEAEKKIIKPQTAQIMTQLLSEVVEEGTARAISLGELVDVAGKSGTSGGDLDRLFIGFTPYYTAGIWCGYPTKRTAIGAVEKTHFEIWDEVMRKIHDVCITGGDDEVEGFDTHDLIELEYCRDSGDLVCEGCELDLRENRVATGYFTLDNMPTSECKRHVIIRRGEEMFSLIDYERETFDGIHISDQRYLLNVNGVLPKLNEVGGERKKGGFFEFLKRFF